MTDQVLEMGVLQGCMKAARSVGEAQGAFKTWCVARAIGWREARRLQSLSSFYNYARVLEAAGVPVPHKWKAGPLVRGAEFVGWFGAHTPAEAVQVVTGDPGRIVTLPGSRFRVVRAWEELSPVGTTGRVDRVLFDGAAWSVGFDFEGVPGGYGELPLGDFLRFTVPEPDQEPGRA